MIKNFCDLCGCQIPRPYRNIVRVQVSWYEQNPAGKPGEFFEQHRMLEICPDDRAAIFALMKVEVDPE